MHYKLPRSERAFQKLWVVFFTEDFRGDLDRERHPPVESEIRARTKLCNAYFPHCPSLRAQNRRYFKNLNLEQSARKEDQRSQFYHFGRGHIQVNPFFEGIKPCVAGGSFSKARQLQYRYPANRVLVATVATGQGKRAATPTSLRPSAETEDALLHRFCSLPVSKWRHGHLRRAENVPGVPFRG